MVLRADDVVEAELISQNALLERVVVCLLRRTHVGRLHQEKNPEFHDGPRILAVVRDELERER